MGLSLDFNLCLPRIVGTKGENGLKQKGKAKGLNGMGNKGKCLTRKGRRFRRKRTPKGFERRSSMKIGFTKKLT
ncbi:hypothetical protein AO286_00045 [Pseudomonas syringae]|nr:hypothetical protein BKM19_005875 [Pseudomonas amygdali pv. morsprunorum]KPY23874.1 hypothetical protein ALO54_200182 [Pseudomonas syringae pv. philadelphi]KWS41511.1 hypothetical protein AL059_20640 [Pseudomonas syringae pv. papulans]KWS75150.1 hypothetical protein AL053_19675 [Pseudomonas savastanoi pv. fraxini]PHN66047.1 hypothetical protein AO286_00045 [Pseudomonas syringae]